MHSPGICHPGDIKKMFPADTLKESVRLALDSGNFSIDWWEADTPGYYVRPATIDGIGSRYHPSWGGRCCFLEDAGCSLDFSVRPYTCKRLEPHPDFKCNNHLKENEKLYMSKVWKKKINLGALEV